MNAGKLRERITIERRAPGVTAGEASGEWQQIHYAWARVESLNGREFMASRTAGAEATHRVTLRYPRTAITPACRVVWGARVLEIVAPPTNVDGRGRELQLTCSEVVSG